MPYDKVYVIDKVFAINYFLTLYRPEESNLIVMSDDKTLEAFFQDVLPDQIRRIVPRIPINYFPSAGEFDMQLLQIDEWCKQYRDILFDIGPPTKIYFFSKYNTPHFFILISDLKKRGLDIEYINLVPPSFAKGIERIAEHSLSLPHLMHLQNLKRKIGCNLYVYKFPLWVDIGLGDEYKDNAIIPHSWEKLDEIFSWKKPHISHNTVLFVDGPMEVFQGLNIDISRDRVVGFLSKLIQLGKEIHLKPHYDERLNGHSLVGTALEDKVLVLPKYFPAELLVHDYPEIYGFNSLTLATQVSGRKFTLSKMLVFDSKKNEDLHWYLFKITVNAALDDISEELMEILPNRDATATSPDVGRNVDQQPAMSALLKEAALLNQQGEELFNNGDVSGALERFIRARTVAPDFAATYNNLGVVYWQTGQAQRSIEYFTEGLSLEPHNRDLIINFGQVLTETERHKEAKGLYEHYLAGYPSDRIILDAYNSFMRKISIMTEVVSDGPKKEEGA
ncbi:MAG: hypothetical protein EPN22_00485 [Nitrospirae bacterium]|nr:MAG: hypothetical protein EPN22_00485 [Nitrospirota bacterium]